MDCEVYGSDHESDFNHSILPIMGGLMCKAFGNYGSTSFDPLGSTDEFLSFVLCDDCMVANAENIIWARHAKTTKEYDAKPWIESDELPPSKSA